MYLLQGHYKEMMLRYKQLLTYIKSAVTRNYSEKSINSILDYISTSKQVLSRIYNASAWWGFRWVVERVVECVVKWMVEWRVEWVVEWVDEWVVKWMFAWVVKSKEFHLANSPAGWFATGLLPDHFGRAERGKERAFVVQDEHQAWQVVLRPWGLASAAEDHQTTAHLLPSTPTLLFYFLISESCAFIYFFFIIILFLIWSLFLFLHLFLIIINFIFKCCLSLQTEEGEDDMKKGTQLLEIYALEIQMYTAQKNNKKLKVLLTSGGSILITFMATIEMLTTSADIQNKTLKSIKWCHTWQLDIHQHKTQIKQQPT